MEKVALKHIKTVYIKDDRYNSKVAFICNDKSLYV